MMACSNFFMNIIPSYGSHVTRFGKTCIVHTFDFAHIKSGIGTAHVATSKDLKFAGIIDHKFQVDLTFVTEFS